MIDFSLTETQIQIQRTIRRFVESELLPLERVLLEREVSGISGTSPGLAEGELRTLQDKARELGFWGIDVPEQYGGANLDAVTLAVIHEELGKTIVDFQFGGSILPALYACNAEQMEKYLRPNLNGERISATAISEPGGGSDAKSMRTTAVRDASGWVINGEKTWITRAHTADFVILFARTPKEGDPNGITCFLVDREMGFTSHPIPMMGSRDKVGSLAFNDVRVPHSAVLGEVNHGFDHAMPFIYQNRAYVFSARNVGTMERLVSMTVEWAKSRQLFGRPLSERDNIAMAISEMEIDVRTSKLLTFNAAYKAANGVDYRHDACVTKAHVARAANRVVDSALQIHGALGYAKEYVIERLYRDLRVERIYDGSDEVNLANIARNLVRGHVSSGAIH